jgi:hypothetical protein
MLLSVTRHSRRPMISSVSAQVMIPRHDRVSRSSMILVFSLIHHQDLLQRNKNPNVYGSDLLVSFSERRFSNTSHSVFRRVEIFLWISMSPSLFRLSFVMPSFSRYVSRRDTSCGSSRFSREMLLASDLLLLSYSIIRFRALVASFHISWNPFSMRRERLDLTISSIFAGVYA